MSEHDRAVTAQPIETRQPDPVRKRPDLTWLVRYARHCGFTSEAASVADPVQGQALEQSLRATFGAAAWRIVCRSPRERFAPILRNRELTLSDLVTYCQRLAYLRFLVAPQAILLAYGITQRRLYFNQPCRIPEESDYALMRVADRERRLRMTDIALVTNWAVQINFDIRPQHTWAGLLRRARLHRDREAAAFAAAKRQPWHFFCGEVAWRGWDIQPITDSAQLWLEGALLGHCAYRLRGECQTLTPSRFFSVSRHGKPVATLELVWRPPEQGDIGMDREWGSWCLQDLRLSFNRLPDESLLQAMQAFAQMYNLWAKSPRRMPATELTRLKEQIGRLNAKRSNAQAGWATWTGSLARPA